MKHPNRKAEAQNKWLYEFHKQIKISRKILVEKYVAILEEKNK
jgi:hypothetical protein